MPCSDIKKRFVIEMVLNPVRMSTRSLPFANIPFRQAGYKIAASIVVGATVYFLSESLSQAAGAAGIYLILAVGAAIVEAVIGDYADNLLLGLLFLLFTAVLSVPDPWLPVTILGTLIGCWFLIDGFQHLRYGETRTELSVPYSHDGGPITGILRVFLARLLEPFRLGE